MKKINYSKIYSGLIKGLPEKTITIFNRRFGIKDGKRETLESIGKVLDITRERVRQIEEAGFSFIKKQNKETLEKIFKEFINYFEQKGGLKREDILLQDLGGKNFQSHIFFFLTLGEQFSRVCEKKDFYSFWSVIPQAQTKVKETLNLLIVELEKQGRPLPKNDFCACLSSKSSLIKKGLLSYLEVSKNIRENKEGKVGLVVWPEINPRGVKDKAFLVFKKEQKPLHFTKVAELIDKLEFNLPNKKTYSQTVHNELIKDPRFILVGRGTYALKEWGYEPGTVKDVIVQILKENNQSLDKDELIKKVLSQRLVAKNTVLMNLNNKKYFTKDSEGKYFLKGVQTA